MSSYCYIAMQSQHLNLFEDVMVTLSLIDVKIGSTKDPVRRLAQLQTSNPTLSLFHVFHFFGCGEIIEDSLHKYYRGARLKKEWFSLPAVELAWLRNTASVNWLDSGDDVSRFESKYQPLKGIEGHEDLNELVQLFPSMVKIKGVA